MTRFILLLALVSPADAAVLHMAGTALAGSIDTTKLAPDAVTSDKILNGAVNTNKLASDAVTTAKVLNGAIETGKVASDAITTAKLINSAVNTSKLADDAVSSSKILNGSVDTAKIKDDSVTTAKLINLAVDTSKLAADSVIGSKILNLTIDTSKIKDDSVTTAKIYLNAVDSYKLKSDAGSLAQVSNNKMFVSGDNIGIGSTSPGTLLQIGSAGGSPSWTTGKLYINGTGHQMIVSENDSSVEACFGAVNATASMGSCTGHQVNFMAGGVERLILSNGGNLGVGTAAAEKMFVIGTGFYDTNKIVADVVANVAAKFGIGTTAPSFALHVVNGSTSTLFSGFSTRSGASDYSGQLMVGPNNPAYRGILSYEVGASPYGLFIDNTHDHADGDINFRTRTYGTTVNALTIKGDGNVGIGTTSPTFDLQVVNTTVDTAKVMFGSATNAGCMMIGDTDLAGCTECFALNGTLSCTTDADCVCDGS